MRSAFGIIYLSVILILVLAGCQSEKPRSQQEISFNWQFKMADDSLGWHNAEVPGVAHTDLLAHKLIPNPFIGDNENNVQWVAEKKWEYRTTLNLSHEQKQYTNIDLVFKGLDTYAEVYLNGNSVMEANNMFRTWRVPVNELLAGENELRIVFTPPITKNKNKLEALNYRLPAGSETNEWPVSPFTRKAAYQFGWDFAPRLVTMGIWQPVYLDLWSTARIENVQFKLLSVDSIKANYTVYVGIESRHPAANYRLQVLDSVHTIKLTEGLNTIAIDFAITKPIRWWPNGLGEQKLYEIPVKLFADDVEIDHLTKRIGVRTVELIQQADSIGESFYFKVNGQRIFMKGANWSPLSSYPSAVDDSVYINRIKAVKEANMNMLRVWGGGIYERDLFYDLCDENGILVWQDFMFANSMYPGDEAFIDNVSHEVKEQIIRLRNHPSIALWNGNNEIEVAWKNWGWQKQFGYSSADSAKIWHDYLRIFNQEIPGLIHVFDSGRPYTDSSPLSNWGKPENFNYGSMHYWGVWHGHDAFEDYKDNVGRFMAEYGFQSFPDWQTVMFYTDAKELPLRIPVAHQKSYVGNGWIIKMSEKYFGEPDGATDFVEKSQQAQALAYKMAIEAHRLNRDKCGGTLFWQLNDCWPGPSWSVIDYFGRKKIAYGVVKDRYQPVVLIMENKGTDFTIFAVNDLLKNAKGTMRLEMIDYQENRLWVTEKRLDLGTNSAIRIYRSDTRKLLDGMPPKEVYLKASLLVDSLLVDIEKFYFVLPKNYLGAVDFIGNQ